VNLGINISKEDAEKRRPKTSQKKGSCKTLDQTKRRANSSRMKESGNNNIYCPPCRVRLYGKGRTRCSISLLDPLLKSEGGGVK